MPVPYVRVTSQVIYGDVTILSQKRPSLATMAKSAIDDCFSGIARSGHKIACKKYNNTFVTMNNIFWSLVVRFANDFHPWLRPSWKSLANRLTPDSLFTVIILYVFLWYHQISDTAHKHIHIHTNVDIDINTFYWVYARFPCNITAYKLVSMTSCPTSGLDSISSPCPCSLGIGALCPHWTPCWDAIRYRKYVISVLLQE